jgi:hypothetical protein
MDVMSSRKGLAIAAVFGPAAHLAVSNVRGGFAAAAFRKPRRAVEANARFFYLFRESAVERIVLSQRIDVQGGTHDLKPGVGHGAY